MNNEQLEQDTKRAEDECSTNDVCIDCQLRERFEAGYEAGYEAGQEDGLDLDPGKYMTLCNLIETLWVVDPSEKIDFDNLLPMTSPQARRIATFIVETLARKEVE
jgi:hypothetical protein